MNEIVKKLLLTNDKFISERHLIQLVFNVRKTFKTTRIYFKQCLWDKKKKKRKKKEKNKKKVKKTGHSKYINVFIKTSKQTR